MDEKSNFTGTGNLKNKIIKSNPYNECANFFIVIAVYMFVSNYLLSIISSQISVNKNFSIHISAYLLVFSLLVLIIMSIFKKRAKRSEEILTFKLTEACGLLIVLTDIVIAILNYNNNYVFPPLLWLCPMFVSASICIFMCGSFLNNTKIKTIAFIYSAVALLVLSGVWVYCRNSINYWGNMNTIKLALIVFVIFPASGYLLPGIILKLNKSNDVNDNGEG